jgi:nicotinate-nucleotide--dimethylbenzimidazole phosphoribosyltransferase
MQFDSLDDIRAFCRDLPDGDTSAADAAARRQWTLTKPPGSLGRLEELAIWLARWQACEIPKLERVTIAVFAGNHGVAARGVSAYPQAVTAQMVANFANGGAAINQIARLCDADLRVVPIELDRQTRDFTAAPAMDIDEFLTAVDIGYRTVPPDSDLLAVGEMGIANTTTAAMLCAALLDGFVATAAIVPLARLEAGIVDHCRAGHVSAETGHRGLLRELGLDPLLDLNMRLGEASGAGVAILLLRAALACHAGMATFAEAGVSGAGK